MSYPEGVIHRVNCGLGRRTKKLGCYLQPSQELKLVFRSNIYRHLGFQDGGRIPYILLENEVVEEMGIYCGRVPNQAPGRIDSYPI